MSGTQKPGRSATSAKVLAGSKNTPVSREPSPKPLAWGSGSGSSSGVMIGSIVLQSTPARSGTPERNPKKRDKFVPLCSLSPQYLVALLPPNAVTFPQRTALSNKRVFHKWVGDFTMSLY